MVNPLIYQNLEDLDNSHHRGNNFCGNVYMFALDEVKVEDSEKISSIYSSELY